MTTTSTLTTLTGTQQRVLDNYRAALLAGTVFANRAASHRSVRAGGCVSPRRGYAHAVTTLGQLAARGDAYAQVASAAVRALPLYQTDHELAAKLYESAAACVRAGFDDVVGRSGPEGGRYGVTPFTLTQLVVLAYWLEQATAELYLGQARGVGWCLRALAAELNLSATELPRSSS